jgi:hypothetical protein
VGITPCAPATSSTGPSVGTLAARGPRSRFLPLLPKPADNVLILFSAGAKSNRMIQAHPSEAILVDPAIASLLGAGPARRPSTMGPERTANGAEESHKSLGPLDMRWPHANPRSAPRPRCAYVCVGRNNGGMRSWAVTGRSSIVLARFRGAAMGAGGCRTPAPGSLQSDEP